MKRLQIDLVTGFLGAGKTTFIRNYAQYLIEKGKRIAIVENDYGAINVDRMLLKDLDGDRCDVEMVIGGDADCHRRRLHAKLVTLRMLGYDRIVMEPSGIFDVDDFLDLLRESPLDDWYELGSVIAIVKADLEENMTSESDYLLAAQTADAGVIALSRAQECSPMQMSDTLQHVNRALGEYQCSRRLSDKDVIGKDWAAFEEVDFERIMRAGYRVESHVKLPVAEENSYSSLFYMHTHVQGERPAEVLEKLFDDEKCGNVIRIKGYLQTESGRGYEVNFTRESRDIRRQDTLPEGGEVVIVVGENLDQERIGSYLTYEFGSGKEGLH